MDGVEGAVGPVGGEEGVLILGGEFCPGAENSARGRAGSDVQGRGQAVGVVVGPATGTGAPTVVGAVDDVIDAVRNIPRGALVPLHVGVVGEEFAVLIEGEVELIAEAEGEEFHGFAFGIGAADVAAGGEFVFGVAAGVPHAREEVVLVPTDGAGFFHAGGEVGVVAVGEINGLAVGREGEGVGAVFAAALHLAEEFEFIELIVAVGVAQAPEAAFVWRFTDHDVETVEGVEEAVGTDGGAGSVGGLGAFGRGSGRRIRRGRDGREGDGEFLDLGAGRGAEGREGDTIKAPILVGGEKAAFVVEGEPDPGALRFFGNGVEELDLEAGSDLELGGIGGDGEGGHGGAGGFAGRLGGRSCRFFIFGGVADEDERGGAEEEQRAEAGEPGGERV